MFMACLPLIGRSPSAWLIIQGRDNPQGTAFPGTDTSRDSRCKFGSCKIADEQRVWSSQHECVRTVAEWLHSKQGDKNTRIEIPAYHCHSSSRIWLTNVPASV